MIPERIIEAAVRGGWDGEWDNVLGPIEHRGTENACGWEPVVLSAAFWQALQKYKKFDQPIWHCKSYEIMCIVEGKETSERRCENEFCEYAGWKDLNPASQYGKVHLFLHLLLTQALQEQLDAFWDELLPPTEDKK